MLNCGDETNFLAFSKKDGIASNFNWQYQQYCLTKIKLKINKPMFAAYVWKCIITVAKLQSQTKWHERKLRDISL